MDLKEFLWSVVFVGCILRPAIAFIIKQVWLWFVHRSSDRAQIWWEQKRNHAQRVVEEANRRLGD